jgi:NADH:ubiquinone oxidoreductase subunit E
MSFRKFLFVCTGDDCKDNGSKKLCKDLKDLIQQESHRGKYKIIKTKCMDYCKSGPIIIINNEVLKKASIQDIHQKI